MKPKKKKFKSMSCLHCGKFHDKISDFSKITRAGIWLYLCSNCGYSYSKEYLLK